MSGFQSHVSSLHTMCVLYIVLVSAISLLGVKSENLSFGCMKISNLDSYMKKRSRLLVESKCDETNYCMVFFTFTFFETEAILSPFRINTGDNWQGRRSYSVVAHHKGLSFL